MLTPAAHANARARRAGVDESRHTVALSHAVQQKHPSPEHGEHAQERGTACSGELAGGAEAGARKRVIIIGGGITGLAAAYRLQRLAQERSLPLDITLFEADARLGGKIHTVHTGLDASPAQPRRPDTVSPSAINPDASPAQPRRLDSVSPSAINSDASPAQPRRPDTVSPPASNPDASPVQPRRPDTVSDASGEFVIEAGPDSFLASKPQALSLCAELGLADRLIGTNEAQRRSYIYSRGRLHDLPEGFSGLAPSRVAPLMRSSLISPMGKARLLLDYLLPPRRAHEQQASSLRHRGAGVSETPADESVAAFMRRRLGPEAFDRIIEPLLSGIYAGNADLLSLAATFPQLRQMELARGGLLRGVARPQPQPKAAQSNGAGRKWTGFVSLRGGMGELVVALADRLRVEARTGRRVESISYGASGWSVRAGGQALDADAVIITTPAYATAELLEPLDARLAGLHRAIPHGSTATVSLAFRTEELRPPPAGFGFVVPRIEPRPLLACTFVSNKFAGRAPAGITLIRCFLGRATGEQAASTLPPRDADRISPSAGEQLLQQDDAALIAIARAELKAILGIDAEPLWARLFRWPRGMPQYNLGHLDRVAQIESALEDHPGLFVAGASYRGVGIPDCIRSADETAAKALRFLYHDQGAASRSTV